MGETLRKIALQSPIRASPHKATSVHEVQLQPLANDNNSLCSRLPSEQVQFALGNPDKTRVMVHAMVLSHLQRQKYSPAVMGKYQLTKAN